MEKKAWGIFCNKNGVENITKRLEEFGLDIFEVRPLTMIEMLIYVEEPDLYEPYIVMFHATTLQYEQFVLRNQLSKVF